MWNHKKQTRYFHLSQSLKKLGRYIGRGNKRSIVTTVMENPHLRPHVLEAVAMEIEKEVKKVCSDNHDSILRMKFKEALERFSWDRVWRELSDNVPTLLHLVGTRNPERAIPALCVSVMILLKLRNNKLNLVQALVSIILKAGHATIQVCIISRLSLHSVFQIIGFQSSSKATAMLILQKHFAHSG